MGVLRPLVEGHDGAGGVRAWGRRPVRPVAVPPPEEPPPPRLPWSLPLLRPDPLFRGLAAATAPLAWARILVIPAALAALFAAGFHRHDLLAHSDRMTSSLSVLQHLVAALLAANLLSKIAQGVAMARRGARSREMGVKLLLGFIPRFYIDNAAIGFLDLRGQRACFAAPLLMRLALFAGGILVWAGVRRSGSGLADIAVVLAAIGLTSFLFTANPLWPADGYRWLSIRLERPRLRANAMRVLGLVLRLRPMPADLPRGEFWLLFLYAVVSLAFTAAIVFLVLSAIAHALEAQLRGAGVVIFCLLLAVMAMFLLDRRRRARAASQPSRRAGAAPEGRGPQPRVSGAVLLTRDRRGEARATTLPAAEAGPLDDEARTGDRPGAAGRTRRAVAMTQGRWRAARSGAMPAPPSGADLADLLDAGPDTTERALADSAVDSFVPPIEEDGLASLLDEAWRDEAWDDDDPVAALGLDDGLGGPAALGDPLGLDRTLDDILGLPAEARRDRPDSSAVAEPDPAIPEPAGAALAAPADALALLDDDEDPPPPFLDDVRPPPAPSSGPPRLAATPVLRGDLPLAAEERRREAPRFATDDLDRLLGVGSARPTPARRWRVAAVWLVVLAGLVWAAFLPYAFTVGGEFTVQPLERAEARSRTDGEITEVNVREGDWVASGDVLAVLSNWDELRDVAVNEADRDRLMADLAALEAGASPEQVAVARQAVATAALRVESAQKALDREQALFEAGTVPQSLLDDARAEFDLATANRAEAEAALAVVQAPARQPEIDSLNAALARNEEELSFSRLLLEYTNIRAPVEGQVVSSLDDVPLGAFLPAGGLFAELEDNRTVIAEVEVPETTIAEVAVGASAELRLWSDPETPIEGIVRSIAPRAEERDFGWVIRVQVEVPNPDGRLAANMTGFGKVRAADRPVWQAFGRTLERFFVIELWSWVP